MKTIMIFGAGSAIAQATARLWAQQKASFVLIDRNEDQLRIVADDLRTRGASNVHTIAADLSDLGRHNDLIKKIHLQLAPEALEANEAREAVYLFAYGTLGNQKEGESDFQIAAIELRTNFTSVVSLLTHITNDNRVTRDGLRVTLTVISSVAGDRGRQSNYIYGTAKGALSLWLQGLRNRLTKEQSNIHVLTIKPGFVDTPMTADFKKGLLWVKPEVVARGIVKAVEKQKDIVYAPWFWRYIMLVIKLIPERIFRKMSL